MKISRRAEECVWWWPKWSLISRVYAGTGHAVIRISNYAFPEGDKSYEI